MAAAVEKRWSVTVSDLQAWTYILDCQLCPLRQKPFSFFLFSRTMVFLVGPYAVCPFEMADWLNRLRAFIIYTVFLIKKKKCKKSSVASAASSVALHGLPLRSRSLRSEDVSSRSSFRVTPCRLPLCRCRQNNWSCTDNSPFTDYKKTSLLLQIVASFIRYVAVWWYLWHTHAQQQQLQTKSNWASHIAC